MTVEAVAPDVVPSAEGVLSLRDISKRFGSLVANEGIDLDIRPGEVHAILGENGAGKSTLMKVLYGYHQPTTGEITLGGRPLDLRSPRDGRAAGIGMVFQNFTLVEAMTVAENVALILPDLPFVLPQQRLYREIRAVSERYQFGISPETRVQDLSLGERQKVEILKVLLAQSRIVIFDEPTSVLAPHEIDHLLDIFRALRDDGLAVLFITHKLREVLAVSDRVTVLRRGRMTGSRPAAGLTEHDLVGMMMGRDAPLEDGEIAMPSVRHLPRSAGDVVLSLAGASAASTGVGSLHDISLDLRVGEIVGVAGIAGNGQSTLGDVILGITPLSSGKRFIEGSDASRWSGARTLRAGVACMPENPFTVGSVPEMSVLQNLVLGQRRRFELRRGLALAWARARELFTRLGGTLGFTLPPLDARVSGLSGGNVQRMVFARELARDPSVLVSFYPTRGMDVPSANAARQVLIDRRKQGAAILLISEDLDELFALSDRLLVMHEGRAVALLDPDGTDHHEVGLLMTGGGDGV
jgi:ABC-type uncharacterized transport system ATPase subunit